MEQSERKPIHVARSKSGEPKEEETKTYKVKEGQTWGTNPELQAGDTVELTEAEAAGFEDKLEPVDAPHGDESAPRGAATQYGTTTPQAPAVPKKPGPN